MVCPHNRVVLDVTGGMHFTAGDVWDDIRERVLCLDCNTYLDEAPCETIQGGRNANRQGEHLLWRRQRSRAVARTNRARRQSLGAIPERDATLDTIHIGGSVSDGHSGGIR